MKISAHPIWACKRGSKTVFGGAKFSPLCSFSWPIACILQDITLNLFWIQSRSLRQAVAWVDPESWSWKSAKKCCNSWFATWFRGFTPQSIRPMMKWMKPNLNFIACQRKKVHIKMLLPQWKATFTKKFVDNLPQKEIVVCLKLPYSRGLTKLGA